MLVMVCFHPLFGPHLCVFELLVRLLFTGEKMVLLPPSVLLPGVPLRSALWSDNWELERDFIQKVEHSE